MNSRRAGIGIWSRGFTAIAIAAIAATIGCGDGSQATLSGNVTADGAPVSEGTLLFAPVAGGAKPVNVAVSSDGSYNANGIAVGKNTVSYSAPPAMYPEGHEAKPGEVPPASKWEGYKPSAGEIDVKAGAQTIAIELTK